MKMYIRLSKALCIVALSLSSMLFSGCAGMQEESGGDFALHYLGMTQICPGTNFSVTPTFHGGIPSDFKITEIKCDGRKAEADCFSIDSETGEFFVLDSDKAPTGEYHIGISCVVGSRSYRFDDAIEIQLMRPVPEGIIVDPDRLSVNLSDIHSTEAELPTAQVKTIGNNFVKIKKYIISSVYKNGVVLPEAKKWFDISETGEISIVPGNAAFTSGVFTLDLRLTTYFAGEDYEDGLFKKAVKFDVCAPPLSLAYKTKKMRVEKGYSAKVLEPDFDGSLEGLKFSIKSVSPDNNIGITIDESTGILRFPETDNTEIGDSYSVSIVAENKYGSKDFDNIFTFEVIDFITPVSRLEYSDVAEIITGLEINNEVKEVVGDELTFSFVDLPADLAKGLSINPESGAVTCPKGIELPVGKHEITVSASNIKSSIMTSFFMTILPNPFDFSFVNWGTNMGENSDGRFDNQFRVYCGGDPVKIPIVDSDIPEDAPVEFRFIKKSGFSNRPINLAVDSNTGILTITPITNEEYTATNFAMIKVRVGGDHPAAKTKYFPVFVDQQGYRSGYRIEYTPFVLKVNPRKGGTSGPAVVTMKNGDTPFQFTLDYKRHIYYWNINGPTQWTDGRLSDYGKEHFLYGLWERYYTIIGKSPNTVAVNPLSWYGDKNGLLGNLGNTGCYITPGSLVLTVNPDKFYDVNGEYADGVMQGTMNFNINGIDPINVGGTECWPLIIWFDTSFDN